MEIVLEYVILDNFCIDSMLMWASVKMLKQPILKWGIVCVGVLGAGFACVAPLIRLSGVLAILLKMMIAFVLSVIANFSFRRAFSRFIMFVLLTFGFGGGLIGMFTFLNLPTISGINIFYSSSLPMGAILSCAVGFVIFIIKFIKRISFQLKNRTINFILTIDNKSKLVCGFIDTGNLLHSKDGLPVIVAEEKLLSSWLTSEERMALFLGKYDQPKLHNVNKINVNSLGKNYEMVTFDALAKIGKAKKHVAIGITYQKMKSFDVVLGSELLEG